MDNEFNDFFDGVYEREMKDINNQLDQDILFTLIGNINSGKSSTINVLMGSEAAKVSSKPGETTNIYVYKYTDRILFVDTPGLHDIIHDNSEKTLDYYKKSDIILFFLNAAGEVLSSPEKDVFEKIRKYNDNIIIVLNKIDAAEDISRLTSYIKQFLGEDYPIVPISSKTGENIEELKGQILNILKLKKKDILFAKHVKEKSSIANRWILTASTAAGAIGVSPIPGSDIVPITAIQVGMLLKLSQLYGNPISKEKAKEMIITTITGNTGKAIFHQLVKFFPGYGVLIGGSVASSITFALGQAIKYGYENEITLDASSLKELYDLWKSKDWKYFKNALAF